MSYENEYCPECGHSNCICDEIERENDTRRRLEDYQNEFGLSNDEMTDFIRENDINY